MPSILVVDSDPIQAEVAAAVCHGLGYHVVIAMDAAMALDHAATERFRLALVDFHLPDMAGDALVRRLRETVGDRAFPILGTMVEHTPPDERAMRAAGATGILRKPYVGAALRSALIAARGTGSLNSA